ncbi:MAG: glycosyltransferase [Clostridiales bacterium]|jgi:glycosyltransferase involved in cell wall biosynthesis|nr:glycosyltransferase [Clostridiales bacterium]
MSGNILREPIVGIISPFYDVEPYIKEYLNSISNQTYINFRVFCTDDGSPDNCGKILDYYAVKEKRLTVIHQASSGYNSALNASLDSALHDPHIDFITFIDPDDFVEPKFIETMVSQAIENDADITTVNFFRDKGDKSEIMVNSKCIPCIFTDKTLAFEYGFESDVYRGYKMYLWNKMFRASLFRGKLRMRPDLSTGADSLLTAQCILLANKFAYSNAPLYHYRIRENSIMRSKSFKKRLGFDVALEEIVTLLNNKNFPNRTKSLVKRFHTYYLSQLAEYAYAIKDKEALKYSKDKINLFLKDYYLSSKEYPERLERIDKILQLNL